MKCPVTGVPLKFCTCSADHEAIASAKVPPVDEHGAQHARELQLAYEAGLDDKGPQHAREVRLAFERGQGERWNAFWLGCVAGACVMWIAAAWVWS